MKNAGLTYITEDGRFNNAEILRRAAVLYRRFNGRDKIDLKIAMLSAWGEARGEAALFEARNGYRTTRMVAVAPDVWIAA